MNEEDEFDGADHDEYVTGEFAVCVFIKGRD